MSQSTAYRRCRVDPVEMPAEDPLFLMYTSGTTGRPKGYQHSTGGYLSYVAGTSKYIQDIHPEDVYWCMADIGRITGHSYIVYGPLALAASSVVYEGLAAKAVESLIAEHQCAGSRAAVDLCRPLPSEASWTSENHAHHVAQGGVWFRA